MQTVDANNRRCWYSCRTWFDCVPTPARARTPKHNRIRRDISTSSPERLISRRPGG